jgi:hypothetical protein
VPSEGNRNGQRGGLAALRELKRRLCDAYATHECGTRGRCSVLN